MIWREDLHVNRDKDKNKYKNSYKLQQNTIHKDTVENYETQQSEITRGRYEMREDKMRLNRVIQETVWSEEMCIMIIIIIKTRIITYMIMVWRIELKLNQVESNQSYYIE